MDTLSPAAHLLLYSHDTFGLGHIRRNRKIARALANRFPGLICTVVTGSGMSGHYPPHPRIRFVELPQVEKQPDGTYRAVDPGVSYSEILQARSAAILNCARDTEPQILIADKEPLGLDGELTNTLTYLKGNGAATILGLRDVLDDAETVRKEWLRKGIFDVIEGLYDQIWIYGSERFYDPLEGIGLSDSVLKSCSYTGFLYQQDSDLHKAPPEDLPPDYLLVTAGGGGDGNQLMNAVLGAYEHDSGLDVPAVLLLGPYTPVDAANTIRARASAIERVSVIGFDNEPEVLIEGARAVIGMCGYNTFCEVIFRRKAALFVPRQAPRTEQLIRAERAMELGYADVILASDAADPVRMASAIRSLLQRPVEGPRLKDFDTDGLERICQKVGVTLERLGLTARALERADL